MSADTYLLIRKEAGLWTGYIESASIDQPAYMTTLFEGLSLRDAIVDAQYAETEYVYRFEGMGEDAA